MADTLYLRGIIPPMITPLATPQRLDEIATRRQVRRLLAAGVDGIFVLGTTGEGPGLPYAVRRELIRVTCDEVGDRVPVLAGVSDASFGESVALADYAASRGVCALTLTPPFYFLLGQDEIVAYYEKLASRLPLPFIAYDIPAMTKTHIEPETLKRLLDIDRMVGIKDSSGQMIYHHELQKIVRARPGFSLLIGPEELLAEAVAFGSDGGVPGGANVWPELFVEIFAAARNGDTARVVNLQRTLLRLGDIYRCGRYGSSMIKGVKCALAQMGICEDVMSEPFQPFGPRERQAIAAILDDLGLLRERKRSELAPANGVDAIAL